MSVKKYGICLAYQPEVDLSKEGLGRYLAQFIKGGEDITDIHFIIVCPHWSVDSLKDFLLGESINLDTISIVSSKKISIFWYTYSKIKRTNLFIKRKYYFLRLFSLLERKVKGLYVKAIKLSAQATVINAWLYIPVIIIALIVTSLILMAKLLKSIIHNSLFSKIRQKLKVGLRAFSNPKKLIYEKYSFFLVDLFEAMLHVEMKRMQSIIKKNNDVIGWYCPTPFWPSFSEMDIPILTCVPDNHIVSFPIGFAQEHPLLLGRYKKGIERTIASRKYFVTYSEHQKWNVLVDKNNVPPSNIFVVTHACNDLSPVTTITVGENQDLASNDYCKQHLLRAISSKSKGFNNDNVRFLFYASQFRHNKNVLTLLRAYKYLLSRHSLQHKLILTGNPDNYPDVSRFISDHGLEYDVLCLHNLSLTELAACYKLADLAICPSLSEGGGPFTFSESLSVKTPCLIGKISVAEELISDPELRELTFFDPYSYLDLAKKIQISLENPSYLLDKQLKYYEILSKRTWKDVVSEHISILDKISIEHKKTIGGKHA